MTAPQVGERWTVTLTGTVMIGEEPWICLRTDGDLDFDYQIRATDGMWNRVPDPIKVGDKVRLISASPTVDGVPVDRRTREPGIVVALLHDGWVRIYSDATDGTWPAAPDALRVVASATYEARP